MHKWGYWSRPGNYTLIEANGSLGVAEIASKDVAIVRACNGFLFDRLAFAEDAAIAWNSKRDRGFFTPIGAHRVFVLKKDQS